MKCGCKLGKPYYDGVQTNGLGGGHGNGKPGSQVGGRSCVAARGPLGMNKNSNPWRGPGFGERTTKKRNGVSNKPAGVSG